MFSDLNLAWKLWGWLDQLKGGRMDAATLATIAVTLAPLLTPIIAAGLTTAVRAVVHYTSDKAHGKLEPYLPLVSSIMGATVAAIHGDPLIMGVVGGLAGTGLHQAVKQATTKDAPAAAPPGA